MRTLGLWFLLLLVGVSLMTTVSAAESPWTVTFAGPRGVTLAYAGIPIIRQSTLYIVKPGWTGLLYDDRTQAHRLTRGTESDGPALDVDATNEVFRSHYSLVALDRNTFRLRFRGELLQDVPAEIEYAAGYFNANLIANRPFRAQSATGPRMGVVSAYPVGSDQKANDLVPGFRSLSFDSRIGALTLEARSDQRVMFFDARRDNQDWAKSAPIFWCGLGVPPRPLRFGKPVELELVIRVVPVNAEARPRLEMTACPVEVPAAYSTRERPILVIPQPKHLEVDAAETNPTAAPTGYLLKPGSAWSITGSVGGAKLEAAVRRLLRERVGGRIARGAHHTHSGTWTVIRFGSTRAAPVPHPGAALPEWARNPEGYRLTCTANGIEVAAPTPVGAFYGLQTLDQVLRSTPEGVRPPKLTVLDWPSMKFRGAHWFPSASGVPFDRKLIQRIMARYKMNAAVIQCEAARWDRHPEIAAPNSITKTDLKGLVDLCRANFVDPIPLINCPGHGEWMFRNGQHLDFVEDPQTPYAYCVRNPKSGAFIRDVLREALHLFQPRYLHLGHDEVTIKGRFPNPTCSLCQGHTATELVLENQRGLADWLAKRHVRPMIWGDMLLAKEEAPDAAHAPSLEDARARRAGVAPGTIVADWHYNAATYPSLNLLKSSGLPTIAATWYDPSNIYLFSQAARSAGSLGLLQTTWAGYFPDEKVLRNGLRQYSAFVLAADYAWSGRSERPEQLPYDAATQFRRAYFGERQADRSGGLVDLTSVARTDRSDWLGLGPGWDLGAVPEERHRFAEMEFEVPRGRLVRLGGLGPGGAERLSIGTERRVREIALLNAAVWSVPGGTTVARMIVEYADGSRVEEPFEVGRNTASWQGAGAALDAALAWNAASPAGTPLGLQLTRWQNPHPQRAVARIRFEPVDAEAGWVLAGLTLFN